MFTKKINKGVLFVAIAAVICICAAIALSFVGLNTDVAEAASQHDTVFSGSSHPTSHAGTALTESLLKSHVQQNQTYLIPQGNYYLSQNITVDRMIYVKSNVNLCLNGFSLNVTVGNAIILDDGVTSGTTSTHSTLSIFDCCPSDCSHSAHKNHTVGTQMINGGLITGKFGCIGVSSGTFNLYGGTLAGGEATSEGGGVRVLSGTFNMYGGNIKYNSAGTYGGGVSLGSGCTFTMSGGVISNNESGSNGGGVYLASKAKMTMSGGEISSNRASTGSGICTVTPPNSGMNALVYVQGSAKILNNGEYVDEPDNIHLNSGNKLHVSGTFSSGVHIEINPDTNQIDIDGFDPSKQSINIRSIFFDETGEGYLPKFADGKLSWIGKHTHNDITFTMLDNAAIKGYNNNIPEGKYFLVEDISLTAPLTFAENSSLCLAGYQIKLTSGNTCVIDAGNNFSLYDCCWGVNDKEYSHTYPSAIDGSSKGLNGGLITGGKASGVSAKGNFDLYGGVIAGNSGEKGGGVYVEGDFKMHGGIVCFNLAGKDGGGVYVKDGNAFLESSAGDLGEIRDNKSTLDGGGLYVAGGDFTMTGGKLGRNGGVDDGNVAGSSGGGAYVEGNVTISGGLIAQNDAAYYGGGILVEQTGTISNAEFSNNVAQRGGGAIQIGSGAITDTKILNNTANAQGGGVYVTDGDMVTLSRVTISGNTAGSNGGGVYFGGVKITHSIEDSEISGNTAKCGGGIYQAIASLLNIDGVTLKNNSATTSGPEMYIEGETSLINDGVNIEHDNFVGLIFLTGDLKISSVTALNSLANKNASVTLGSAYDLAVKANLILTDTLKADSSSPTNKVEVLFQSADISGTLVSKQSDCDIDIDKYFKYHPAEGTNYCCYKTNLELIAGNHSLVLDGDPQFSDSTLKTTYSLKCEHCELAKSITLGATSSTVVHEVSCTKAGVRRYDFELSSDSLTQNLGDDSKYCELKNPSSTSNEVNFGTPIGHHWQLRVKEHNSSWEGNAQITCSNPQHNENWGDGDKLRRLSYCSFKFHPGTIVPTYDGTEYEPAIDDEGDFRGAVNVTQKIEYSETDRNPQYSEVDEIKNAGFYRISVYTDMDKRNPLFVIQEEVSKATLTYQLNKSDSLFTGEDIGDIEVKVNGVAVGEELQKGTDYNVQFNGGSALPKDVGSYSVALVLSDTALAKNYQCTQQTLTFVVRNAKIEPNAHYDTYKHGVDKIYDPENSVELNFAEYGTGDFPFTLAAGKIPTIQYIVKEYDLATGSSSDEIAAYLAELQNGGHSEEWQNYSSDMAKQDPKAYCVYFKIEADRHDTYYGYYMLHIYNVLYTITLSSKDLALGALQYGDAFISSNDLNDKIKGMTVSIFESAVGGGATGGDKKNDLFADDNFEFYLSRNGARFTGTYYEVGTYFAQAKYVDSANGDNKYISFEWKLESGDDGRPTFEVAKRDLTFVLNADGGVYKTSPFDDVDVTFSGLQNGETLTKAVDYKLLYNDKEDMPVGAAEYIVIVALLDSSISSNYAISDETEHKFTVSKQPVARLVKTSETLVYNGESQSVEVAEFNADLMIAQSDRGNFVYQTKVFSAKDAGEYVLNISLADANNYMWAIEGGDETFTFTVQTATLIVDLPSDTYNGDDFDLLQDILGVGSDKLYRGIDYTVKYNDADALPHDAGRYLVTITLLDTSLARNYKLDGQENVFNVAKAPLSIEMGSAVFDGNGKRASLAGMIGDETLVEGTDYVVKYNGGDALPVYAGDYTVTVELLNTPIANNYTLTATSEQYSVTKARLAKLTSQEISSKMYGKTKIFDVTGYDPALYVISGGKIKDGKLSVEREGRYSVTVSIKDKANYMWEDGTSDDIVITLSVVDPRIIGFEETIIMSSAIPAGVLIIAGVALTIILVKRKKRKAAKHSDDAPDGSDGGASDDETADASSDDGAKTGAQGSGETETAEHVEVGDEEYVENSVDGSVENDEGTIEGVNDEPKIETPNTAQTVDSSDPIEA